MQKESAMTSTTAPETQSAATTQRTLALFTWFIALALFAPVIGWLHTLDVLDEIMQLFFHGRGTGLPGTCRTRSGNQFLHPVRE